MDQQQMGTQSQMTGQTGGNTLSGFSKVINWCLGALIFLVPLFFLPFTAEANEFNKQTLTFLLVVVMLGVWVVRILTTRSVSWVKTSLDYVLLAYILIYTVASFMSLDTVSSFLGYYGRFTGSLLSVISFVVLYYIIVNNVRNAKVTNFLTNAMLLSGGIVVIYSLLQIFGLHLIPLSFAKANSYNTIGSLVSLGLFTAGTLVFVQWAWLVKNAGKYWNIFFGVVTVAGLLVMFFVNAFAAWAILALAMIVFLALVMVLIPSSSVSQMWVWKPLLVLAVAVLFVGFQFLPEGINPRNMIGSNVVKLPVEIQLSNSATWSMVRNALTLKPILGFGPGTTGIAFGQIKPETLNQSIVWNLSFDRASSEVASIAIETGLLGLLAFEAASILFLLYALFFLLKKTDHPGHMHAFGLFMLWMTLYISHFFYFFNTTAYFMYWVSLALFVAITHWKDAETETAASTFSDSPRAALSWMFASLLVLAVLLIGAFFQIAVYVADVSYASGLRELQKQSPDLQKSADSFLAATRGNKYRDVYYLAYGQNIVFTAAREARKETPDYTKFQGWIRDMIAAGNAATQYSPNKASNWAARGQFYSQVRALSVPGTDEIIIASAEEAVKKDSRNAILQLQLGQAYANAAETVDPKVVSGGLDTDADGLSDDNEKKLGSNEKNSDSNANGVSDGDEVKAGFNPAGNGRLNAAQLKLFTKIDQDRLRQAEEALKKTIDLRGNIPDAYLSLGRVYEKWGKLPEAKQILEKGSKLLPNNADLMYEYGRITLNNQEYDAAETIFKSVVKLVPDYANAHYSLGILALRKQDKATALTEFKKTLEIVGSNAELEKAIEELEKPVTPAP